MGDAVPVLENYAIGAKSGRNYNKETFDVAITKKACGVGESQYL